MTDIILERRIAAPPSVVFRYLVDSEEWVRWQGVEATVEGVAGGVFSVRMPNGTTARGRFLEVDPDRKIVFTWGWVDHPGVPPGSTRVEISLEDADGATLLTLTHSSLPESEIRLHTAGWNHYVPRLVEAAEGRDPGPDTGLQ